MDDDAAKATRNCEKEGPLMMYVSKMESISGRGRSYAFGRVLSGTFFIGERVWFQGLHSEPGTKEDVHMKSIQRTVLMMGHTTEQIVAVPCGSTVALVAIDQYLLKSGTFMALHDAHNTVDRKYSVTPIMKVVVKVTDGKELSKLVEGLKKPPKSDPLLLCTTGESGEDVIVGSGEMHVGTCLKSLRGACAQCYFIASDPVVSCRESVPQLSW